MKATTAHLVLYGSVLLSMAACGGTDTSTDTVPRPLELDSAVDPAGSARMDQVVQGTLGQMDPVTMTFTLADDPAARIFKITDETEVTGIPSVQGLAGRAGGQVTVHYREDAGQWVATRILLE